MKHKLLCGLIAFLLLISFSACAVSSSKQKETVDTSLPTSWAKPIHIKENYWYLACKNTNVVLYKNLSGSQGIQFELVTSFQFNADELTAELETSVPNLSYKVDCYKDVQEDDEVFPFYLYQAYRGMDWHRMGVLAKNCSENSSADTETNQNFQQMQNMYMEGYKTSLAQGTLPRLYRYVVGIGFNLNKLNSLGRVNAITLKLHGEKKRYTLDNLILNGEKQFKFDNTGISTNIAITDAPIHISKDGVLDLTYLDLQSKKPFTLKGLSLFGEDTVAITDCSVTLTQADGMTTEMKWDCKTHIQVLAGESVRIHSFCKDPRLASVMEAATTEYIMVHYLSDEGKDCTELVQGIYRMRQGLYDLYAAADGINVLSYYLDYYSVNPNMIQVK